MLKSFGTKQPGVQYVDRPGSYAILQEKDGRLAAVRTANGCFLPGGGSDPGESPEQTLHREVMEEIGFKLSNLRLIGEAEQYLFSRFYQKAFRKHGYFFEADWATVPGAKCAADHTLEWIPRSLVVETLSLDFQKWMAKKSLGL